MDACLVWGTGVFMSWIVPFTGISSSLCPCHPRAVRSRPGTGKLRIFTVLRAFRLLRLARKLSGPCDTLRGPRGAQVAGLQRGLFVPWIGRPGLQLAEMS